MKARVISVVLYDQVDNSFDGVVTGNESWFVYIYLSDYMFATGRNEIVPKEKQTIWARKVMLTIFRRAASDYSGSTTTWSGIHLKIFYPSYPT
jgi:hypothetical protein